MRAGGRAESGKSNGFPLSSASTLAHTLRPKSLRFKCSNYRLSESPLPKSYQIGRERSRTLTLLLRKGSRPGGWTLRRPLKSPSPPEALSDVPPNRTTGAPRPRRASHRPPPRDFLLGAALGPKPRRPARRPACRPRQAAGEVLPRPIPAAIFRPRPPPRRGGGGRSRRRRLRRGAPVSAAAPRARYAGPQPPRGL